MIWSTKKSLSTHDWSEKTNASRESNNNMLSFELVENTRSSLFFYLFIYLNNTLSASLVNLLHKTQKKKKKVVFLIFFTAHGECHKHKTRVDLLDVISWVFGAHCRYLGLHQNPFFFFFFFFKYWKEENFEQSKKGWRLKHTHIIPKTRLSSNKKIIIFCWFICVCKK